MLRKQINYATLAIIIIVTVMSLGVSFQSLNVNVLTTRFLELTVYTIITAFALILSVPLSRSELSIAHAIGLIAFFSLPADVVPAMTIAIFIGGVIGGTIRSRLEPKRRYDSPAWYVTAIHITARVTLSYFVASQIYINVFTA